MKGQNYMHFENLNQLLDALIYHWTCCGQYDAERNEVYTNAAKKFILDNRCSRERLTDVVYYASESRAIAIELIEFIVDTYGLEVIPQHVEYYESYKDKMDHIAAGFGGHLFYAASIERDTEKNQRYMRLLRYLKSKGFHGDLTVSFRGDGRRSGKCIDYAADWAQIDIASAS